MSRACERWHPCRGGKKWLRPSRATAHGRSRARRPGHVHRRDDQQHGRPNPGINKRILRGHGRRGGPCLERTPRNQRGDRRSRRHQLVRGQRGV
ncbi:hypothetical protein NDU88_005405 [Pleurodeles waltl]|uniref:Uncharacterized protein n=1 Tax=Pleurodeles waltl TaxID=8319 RepID=A0AAV7QFK3_PLEWA|nr:hypothetical protein NDU88_005405 [Pleurodeles waltl]